MRSSAKCCVLAIGVVLLPMLAHAQAAGAPTAADIAALKQAVAEAKNSADNTWMLVSAALEPGQQVEVTLSSQDHAGPLRISAEVT